MDESTNIQEENGHQPKNNQEKILVADLFRNIGGVINTVVNTAQFIFIVLAVFIFLRGLIAVYKDIQ